MKIGKLLALPSIKLLHAVVGEPEIYRRVEYNAYAEAKLQHDEHGEDRRRQPIAQVMLQPEFVGDAVGMAANVQTNKRKRDNRHRPLDGFVPATVRRPMSKRDPPRGQKLRPAQPPALRFPRRTHTHCMPGPITNVTAMPWLKQRWMTEIMANAAVLSANSAY